MLLSNTLDTSFCLEALDRALQSTRPEIFNTDQGIQFASQQLIDRLRSAKIRISWGERG